MDPVSSGRRIAGLLGFNPGPGLYSRMTRAVEQMPKVIRTQELPGLLRKYPEGVPGWEVKSVAPALEGVESIPRQDLLDLIQQHSPAYTHREKMLGGDDQSRSRLPYVSLGESTPSARPIFEDYGQGGKDYREVLILQPGAVGENYGSHWNAVFGANNAVAHARYDTHGDALRINELQSDLGIHNRKMREAGPPPEYAGGDGAFDFIPRQSEEEMAAMRARSRVFPFPLEDAWSDILIKRLALEAARGGHRAIEVASPRSIADKVGGNIDNYEHFYGKVVPGAIERLGRKMGGMTQVDSAPPPAWFDLSPWENEHMAVVREAGLSVPARAQESFQKVRDAYRMLDRGLPYSNEVLRAAADSLALNLSAAGRPASDMPSLMELAQRHNRVTAGKVAATEAATNGLPRPSSLPPGRRYIMSDEMRRRILEGGIGLSVLSGLATQEE